MADGFKTSTVFLKIMITSPRRRMRSETQSAELRRTRQSARGIECKGQVAIRFRCAKGREEPAAQVLHN